MFLHTVSPPGPRHQRHLAPGAAPWLGALCTSVTLLLSPVITAVCRCATILTDTCLNLSILTCHNCHNIILTCGRRKSTRLVAVAGGLVTALGCLFTSFASQWHQVFIRQNINRAVSQNFTSPARDNLIMISQPIVMNRFSKLLMILLSYPYLLNGQYYLVVK